MEKEKILEAAKKNPAKSQEYENKVQIRSSFIGVGASIIVGIVLYLVDYFINNNINIGFIAIAMTAGGVQELYEGIRLKKPVIIIAGVVFLIFAMLAIIMFVFQAVTK